MHDTSRYSDRAISAAKSDARDGLRRDTGAAAVVMVMISSSRPVAAAPIRAAEPEAPAGSRVRRTRVQFRRCAGPSRRR